ncbi:MAG TPA: multicopper oxidase domain-containing protein [Gemmatimonadales bacterium]|nr:multicopper oxidase domain-containing protein [Gemmatimonadales bacterium]
MPLHRVSLSDAIVLLAVTLAAACQHRAPPPGLPVRPEQPPPEGIAVPTPAGSTGRTRTYYIAADEVNWDYVTGGRDGILNRPYAESAFVKNGPPRVVSTVYKKVLFREYTDSSFRTLKPRAPEWEHLGFLGPLIRGVVGDTLRVVFRNNGHRPYSIHPHGVFYRKDAEGAPYADGTAAADKADDGVPPGGTYAYVWQVPERAGPGPGDGSSVLWMYHSHVDETRDINSGLLGVIIITARGKARPDGSPADVDREIVASFDQVHEEDSWLADQNLPASLMQAGPVPNPSQRQNFYPWFVLFSINGFTHGSLPPSALTLRVGQRVRWYVMGSTNDFDFHSPHWHGNTVTIGHMRTDVALVGDMGMLVADMIPDDPGIWLLHCHISFHNNAGMAVLYSVVP